MNAVWVERDKPQQVPSQYLKPTVTDATELINAPNYRLLTTAGLKRVVSLPADLSTLDAGELDRINTFLSWAKSQGAHRTYIAQHRRPWWRVSLPRPAPILMTYMARSASRLRKKHMRRSYYQHRPRSVPPCTLTEDDLDLIIQWLNTNICTSSGRTYAGGLTKFEPREVMRLHMPPLDVLREL